MGLLDNLKNFGKKDSILVGDWATSYSQGIWQVYRVLEYKELDPKTEKIKQASSVFLKRFLNKAFAKSFSQEVCSPHFVGPLSAEQQAGLRNFIEKNPSTYKQFQEYVPKVIDAVFNATFDIPAGKNIKKTEALIPKDVLLTDLEIRPFLREHGLTKEKSFGWTAHFVSRNFELKGGFLGYRFERILPH